MFFSVVISVLATWISYLWWLQQRPRNFPPGPKGWPMLGNLGQLGPLPHEGVCKFGAKYGDIFSLFFGSYPVVVLNSADLIRKAFKTRAFEGRPSFLPLMSLMPGGLSFNTGEPWKEQRRFVLHKLRDYGFGKSSMEDSIVETVTETVEYLKDLKQQSLFPKPIFSMAALNTLWSIISGVKHKFTDKDIQQMQKIGELAFQDPPVLGLFYFMPLAVKLFPKLTGFDVCLKNAPKFKQLCWQIGLNNAETFDPNVERHLVDSYWKKMQETTDSTSSFYKEAGEENFKATIAALFLAGYDTIATTLSWTVLYLGNHPQVYERLAAEIDRVCGPGESVPRLQDLQRMPYTEATMAEVLRHSSTVPQALPHCTTEDVNFEGYFIPKDTIVIPNLHGVHHDPKIWGDPENFRPERHLNDNGDYVKSESLLPFGTGKRVCIAETMAMSEFFLYLTGLVKAFRFEFDADKHPGGKAEVKTDCRLINGPAKYHVRFITKLNRS